MKLGIVSIQGGAAQQAWGCRLADINDVERLTAAHETKPAESKMVARSSQGEPAEESCLGGLVEIDDRHASIAKGQVSISIHDGYECWRGGQLHFAEVYRICRRATSRMTNW